VCDTFVALANSTAGGSVIFGKNSDCEPNEVHKLVLIPRAHHQDGEQVSCTYIELPQVRDTNAVLLSKPFWIWGVEMGAIEHGLVIGNEAVFTKVPYEKEPGLIGMDFLRLALERTFAANEALALMIDLLETFGQGGNCGFKHSIEKTFTQEANALTGEMQSLRKALSQSCFDRAQEAEADWLKALKDSPTNYHRSVFDKLAWEKFNRQADRL